MTRVLRCGALLATRRTLTSTPEELLRASRHGLEERQFLDELKLLVRTRWLVFARGQDVFERLCVE